MPTPAPRPTVALVSCDGTLLALLQRMFELSEAHVAAYFLSRPFPDSSQVSAFLDQHAPGVVVFDLVPPYADSLRYVQQLQQTGAGRRFLLTTQDAAALLEATGETGVLHVTRDITQLAELGRVVRSALAEQ